MDGKIYYKEIYEKILNDIAEGVYTKDVLLPFERELCEKYDVSLTTIRRALKMLANDHYIIKIKGKGSFVNPEIELESRNDDINCLGVLFFGDRKGVVYDEYYHYSNCWSAKIYNNIFMQLKNDYTVVFETMYKDEIEEKFENHTTVLDNISRLLLITYSNVDTKILDYLKNRGKQLIIYNYFNYRYEICNVMSNEREIFYQTVTRLFKMKHRKIAIINGLADRQYSDCIERFMGYQAAFITRGYFINENLIKWTISPRDAYFKMKEIFELPKGEWPTAVICINDGIALGVYDAIKEQGLKIPEDISVIGHDNDKVGAKLEPPLTSIDPIYKDVAIAIVSCFKRRLWNKNDKVVVKGRMVMRGSLIENTKDIGE